MNANVNTMTLGAAIHLFIYCIIILIARYLVIGWLLYTSDSVAHVEGSTSTYGMP